MALLVVIALVLLGLAGIVVGIVALRDDAPRWTLRIKRPGWLLVLGGVALVLALLVNTSRRSIEEDVYEYVGQQVTCEKIGALEVEGQQRDVHACDAKDDGANLGCFARVGDTILDVTRRFQELGRAEC